MSGRLHHEPQEIGRINMPRKPRRTDFMRANCSNHWRLGCLGGGRISSWCPADTPGYDDPTGFFRNELPVCMVMLGLPCKYFEVCVLPSIQKAGLQPIAEMYYAEIGKLSSEECLSRLEAIEPRDLEVKITIHPFLGHSANYWLSRDKRLTRKCPDCGAGLARRQRICTECRRKRRRKAYRREKRRQRAKTTV